MTSKNTDKNSTYIFPKWTNSLPTFLLLGLILKIVVVVFVMWYWFSPENYNVGYKPVQPIPFSHQFHAGELGLDCRYCHQFVESAAHANIPSSETCMNCHNVIKKDSPHIMKIRESVVEDKPIEWIQIHRLPGYAYFNHSAHVNAGVSCVSCHGRVDQMEEVHQVEPLSMKWCLDCHREPEKHLRPKQFVTQLDWEAENQLELGKKLQEAHKIYPGEDCNTCHR